MDAAFTRRYAHARTGRGRGSTFLGKLRDDHFPELRGTPNFGDRLGILMSNAGDTTLAQRLRADGKLQIDMLERLGEDLLEALDYLDRNGINHRDIKPGNIGIGQDKDKRLRLMLFDFSLSRAPTEKIHAGTRPYLEPFLSERKPPRWDPQAERYAAAVTLYEMATGSLPRWGDGQSDPAMVDGEITLDTELFDPHIRERLTEFFGRMFRRSPTERFDNAEQMLKAWRAVFADLDRSTSSTDSGDADEKTLDARMEAVLSEVTRDSTLTSLPFTLRAQSVLQRLNLTRVRDLLEMQVFRIYRLPGVGNRTRREIGRAWEKLYRHFAGQGSVTPPPVAEDYRHGVRSVDQIAREVVPARGDVALDVIAEILGMAHAKPGVVDWPGEREVASRLGIQRSEVADTLKRLRARWEKSVPALTALRVDIRAILEREGGIMTITELVRAVLTVRGSASPEPVRSANASAATRAAVEAERSLKEPSYVMSRLSTGAVVVVVNPELADWATRLAAIADDLARAETIVAPTRVRDLVGRVKPPDGLAAQMTPEKVVELAATVSRGAAVSSLGEVYPREMEPVRTLKLAQGAVIGADELSVEEFSARVRERYPKAARLPERPYLDDLLKQAGLDFEWNPGARDGKGAYINKLREQIRSSTGSSSLTRYRTATPPAEESPQEQSALEFEERLERAIRSGAFLAIAVGTPKMLKAEDEIARRFDVSRISIDQLLIREMRAAAEKAEIKWPVVLRADRSDRESRDWRNLMAVVKRAMPAVKTAIEEAGRERTVLISRLGLLARYDQLDLFNWLREWVGARDGIRGAWALIACDKATTMPVLDGHPVPVFTAAQWARIPDDWIRNLHRSAASETSDSGQQQG
jgi:protein kinase-like protein